MASKTLNLRRFVPGLLFGWATAALFAFTFHFEEPACVIALDRMNILYCGVDNPVSILVRGVPEADVRIETSDNLTIKKDRNLYYTVRAGTPGEGSITVSGGNLKPVTFRYRVKRFPDPVPRLGARYRSGTIGNGEFKAQAGLAAIVENLDIDVRCETVSYNLIHLRKGQMLAEVTNHGARYEAVVQPIIDAARPGDTYIFEDIKVRCPGDSVARPLESLTFVIK